MIAISLSDRGLQGVIPVTEQRPATTHDNVCTAILWRLEGMLPHLSSRMIVWTPVCLEQIAVLPGSSGVAGVGRARSGSPVGRRRRRRWRGKMLMER